VDCSFPHNTTDPAQFPPISSQCNTTTGYDGPSGVGTPRGAALFTPTSPSASLRTPKRVRLRKRTAFTAVAKERIAGQHVTHVTFSWGDGHSSSGTTLRGSHTYTKKGRYEVGVVVTDSAGGQSGSHIRVTVGERLPGTLSGPHTVRHGDRARFEVTARDLNTGGKITKIRWDWGDHHSSEGKKAAHTWQAKGNYRVTVTVSDNTGVRTRHTRHIRVS
jgi:PKD repeat protein